MGSIGCDPQATNASSQPCAALLAAHNSPSCRASPSAHRCAAAKLQRVREENERLRAEATRLRTLLGQACDGSGSVAPVATAAAGLPGCSPATATATLQQLQAASSGSLPDALAPAMGHAAGLPLAAAVGGSGGAFRPTAAARPLSAATLAELPSSASGTAALGGGAPSGKGSLATAPPKQVQGALNLYDRDLQAFAASVQLERVPADGEGCPLRCGPCARSAMHACNACLQMPFAG